VPMQCASALRGNYPRTGLRSIHMAFGTGPNNNPKESEDRSNRPGRQNNPADNPNKKDRIRGEDDVLKDQEDFESEPLDEKEDVETE
jgi:hypothetical protein